MNVASKVMFETPLLVFAKSLGLIETIRDTNAPIDHAWTMANVIMNVFSGHTVYVTFANFGGVDVHLQNTK